MAASRRRLVFALAASTIALGGVAAGCGSDSKSASGTSGGGSSLSGSILADGSSTLGPLTSAAGEAFNADNPDVAVEVRQSGTGGGFEVFCAGETDISNASREIKDDEAKTCADKGVKYEEFRIASDGITLVTKKDAAIGDTKLTLKQLAAIWGPDSKLDNWSAIPGGGFSDVKLTLAGPGSQSGTYDFFNEKVLGKDAADKVIESRQDYAASEDDNVTVRAVEGAPGGLGYFGFSYYEANQDKLAAFSLDGVTPSTKTITDGTYPLSRPLIVYVKTESLARPEVTAFMKYYITNAIKIAAEQKFVPTTQATVTEDLAKLAG